MSIIRSFIHLAITHSFVSSLALVGARDTAVTETASDSPEWSALGSQSARPSLEGWQAGDKGGFPEEGPCERIPKELGEMHWVGISVWFMAGSPEPGTVPSTGSAPSSVSLVT